MGTLQNMIIVTQLNKMDSLLATYRGFKLETLLFGDKNIDNTDNIILAVHDYIKIPERF